MPGGPCQRVRVWVRAALIAAAWLELTPPDEQRICTQSFPSLAHVTCLCVLLAMTALVVWLDVSVLTVSRDFTAVLPGFWQFALDCQSMLNSLDTIWCTWPVTPVHLLH